MWRNLDAPLSIDNGRCDCGSGTAGLAKGLDRRPVGHGFARHSVFTVVSAERERCVLRLLDTPLSRLSFPFSFCLEATFTLDHTSLLVGLRLTNTDSVPFPAAFGFHPGFAYPLPGASGPHTVRWHGDGAPSIRRLDPNGLIQPREALPSPSRESTIGIDSLDGGAIFLSDWGGIVTFGPVTGPQLRIETEGFAFLGLWTVREGPFLCIEPCTGLADAAGDLRDLADRPGATLLEPGATMSAHAIIVPRASS